MSVSAPHKWTCSFIQHASSKNGLGKPFQVTGQEALLDVTETDEAEDTHVRPSPSEGTSVSQIVEFSKCSP